MSREAERGWKGYGFPAVGFLPVWKPAEGLEQALAERNLPFAAERDAEESAEEELLPFFRETGGGQKWSREFDRRLRLTAGRYLNHLKLGDPTRQENLSDLSDILWTWEELLVAASEDGEKGIADPLRGTLAPEWNLRWLLQRQRAVNLLRYPSVPYLYDCVYGSTHTGYPSSPADAIAAAVAGRRTIPERGLPSTYVRNIYGPDHGWREGSYCCDVQITQKIYASLPEGLVPDGNVYLAMKVTGADGSDTTFSCGGRLSVGMNILTADADGVFIEFPDADLSGAAATPGRDRETFGGWKATACQAFADYGSMFHFKDEEEDENLL